MLLLSLELDCVLVTKPVGAPCYRGLNPNSDHGPESEDKKAVRGQVAMDLPPWFTTAAAEGRIDSAQGPLHMHEVVIIVLVTV